MNTWDYWRKQAKDETLSPNERMLAWENACNQMENALYAAGYKASDRDVLREIGQRRDVRPLTGAAAVIAAEASALPDAGGLRVTCLKQADGSMLTRIEAMGREGDADDQ